MSCTCQDTAGQLCDCCAGAAQATPAVVANRPGLPSVRYRVGTWSAFLASMEAALSGSDVPALAGLRTRSNSDFSVALVDAWSEVLDILTFYTERLANEAYLGTAVEGRSVFELSRLVGYKPSPGVSASTVLVFTLSTGPGAPASVPIAAGTRVQSIPGPGQTPQVFETSTPFTATIAHNAIAAATSQPWQIQGSETSTWVAGTSNNIRVGDVLLFISAPGGIPSTVGPAAVVNVTAVLTDPMGGNTLVSWDRALPSSFASGESEVALYIFRTKASLFGATAPSPGMFPATTIIYVPGNPGANTSADWSWVYGDDQTVHLDNAYPGLNPVASGTSAAADQSQWMVLTGPQYTSFFQIKSASESSPRLYGISSKTSQLTLATGTVLAGNFNLSSHLDELLWEFVQETRVTTAYVQSQLLTLADLPRTDWSQIETYPTPGMLAPVQGPSILVQGSQPIAPNAPVGISGKRVRIAATIALDGTNGGFTPAGAAGASATSPYQPYLVEAFPPSVDPETGNLLWNVLTAAGDPGVLSVPPASFQLQPSVSADPVVGEPAVVSKVEIKGSTTVLDLASPLSRIYDTATVTVNANAVIATHGETVQEILGSADATNPTLTFQLKQSPLTYTSAATATGSQSTLQVRVNNLLWNEVDNFLGSAAKDRTYLTRPNSGTGATVQFGNGIQGSRTPTGQSNIRAQYRKGIGLAGMVAAGQLTQPIDRPLGLQAVTNPGAATGGADPATPDQARQSAPLPTLTLGRVVSLEDYQNFALGFAGITLATATWTWFGNTRGVFLTLAGAGGSTLDASDTVVQNLLTAYQELGLPHVQVAAASYTPVLFEIGLQVQVDSPTWDPASVLSLVWQNLSDTFSFGKMRPGQGVASSQVVLVAQQVPGVVALNLVSLGRSGDPAGIEDFLCASGPRPAANPPRGAEVLLLDPASKGNVGVWS